MTVFVCSLKNEIPQSIPNDGEYHVVRFPPAVSAEPYDVHGMHQQVQPDGYVIRDWRHDDRSGLIWPAREGWGSLTAVLYWEGGDYSEVRDRFVRDPLNLADGYDSTATEDRPPTPGGQFLHKSHELFVAPGTPLAVLVRHNASLPRRLLLTEFKLAIHPA